MRLGAGGLLRDDQPLSPGLEDTGWQSSLWDEVAAGDFREPIPPFTQGSWEAVPATLQELDCGGGRSPALT